MRITRPVGVLAIFVIAMSLTACKGPLGPEVAPSSSAAEEATPTPEPTPTQARETGLTQPAQVFGGDCHALFTDADVTAAIGAPMALQTTTWDPGFAAPRVGAIDCSWAGTASGSTKLVSVIAIPAGVVSYTEKTGCGVVGEGFTGCALEAVQNGIRISGVVADYAGGAAAEVAAQGALLARFAITATDAMSAPAPIAAIGSWETLPDCAAVVDRADFSGVPGLGASSTGEEWGGFDGYWPDAKGELWRSISPLECAIVGSGAHVQFRAYGGARWLGAQKVAAQSASALSVDGVDEVWATKRDGRVFIDVLDGPNWLNFDVAFVKNAGPIAAQLVASLDATAVH